MSQGQTVLVTGANGFVGGHLVRRLIENGDRVICLIRRGRNVNIFGDEPECLEVIAVDAFSDDALAIALKHLKFDTIFHLAAYGVRPTDRDPRMMTDINVVATARLFELAAKAGCGRFVMAGSCAEYAPTVVAAPIVEQSPLETRALYGASKAAASLLLSALCTSRGMHFAVLRLFNVFGPGEAAHRLLPTIINRIAAGQRVSLSPGTQLRDFVYVDDAIDGLLAAATALAVGPEKSGIYNCASGIGTSVRRFAELVGEACGGAPDQLEFGAIAMRPDELPYLVGNPAALHAATGWKPRRNIVEAIRKSVAASYPGEKRPIANSYGMHHHDRS